jgi:hypothetical protein
MLGQACCDGSVAAAPVVPHLPSLTRALRRVDNSRSLSDSISIVQLVSIHNNLGLAKRRVGCPAAYRGAVIDAATSAFLEAMVADLRQQLGIAGTVASVSLDELQPDGVTLVAAIRVARDEIVIRGTGENILAAYANLRLSIPQPVLRSAFVQVVDI